MEIVKTVGVPALQVLGIMWFLKKFVLSSSNGEHTKEIAANVATTLVTAQRLNEQHNDLERTKHFDQLRRDLTTTIERQAELSRDDFRNAIATMFLEQQLERRRERDT
jgi:hypothetical protein